MFGSSKSSALLGQQGIQDTDPTEDEKASGSQTSRHPPPPALPPAALPRGVWLKLSSDLETAAGDRGVGWGAGGKVSSLCSQRFLGADLGAGLRQEGAILESLPLPRQHLQDVSSP